MGGGVEQKGKENEEELMGMDNSVVIAVGRVNGGGRGNRGDKCDEKIKKNIIYGLEECKWRCLITRIKKKCISL